MIRPFIILTFSISLIGSLTSPMRASEQLVSDYFLKIQNFTSELVTPITTIYELNDVDELNGFFDEKPTYIKFRINENIEVLQGNNENLGDFYTFYLEYIEGNFLPLIEITSEKIAINYIEYVNSYFVRDAAIYSDNIEIFKAYSQNSYLNRNYFVYDITKFDLSNEENVQNLTSVSTMAHVDIFVIGVENQNFFDCIDVFRSHNKVVWTRILTENHFFRAVNGGSSGIIYSKNSVLRDFSTTFTYKGQVNALYASAHRGAVDSTVNENSISSIRRAAELGADYVEIDLQITKDNKIVLCHQDQLNVTTSCTTNARFSLSNYEDIQKYTLTDNGVDVGEKIPLLEEVFEDNLDNDLMFILEFKFDGGFITGNMDVAKYVNEVVRKYHMEHRVLGITFYKIYFESMNEHMGYMPKMYLGLETLDTEYTSIAEFAQTIRYFRKYSTGFDISYNDSIIENASNYLSRGYLLNSWTFTDNSFLSKPLNIVTTDNTEEVTKLVKKIEVTKNKIDKFSDLENFSDYKLLNYRDEEVDGEAKLIILSGDSTSKNAYATLFYEDKNNDYGLYSDLIEFAIKENGGEITINENANGKEIFPYNIDNFDEIPELEPESEINLLLIILSSVISFLIILTITIILILKYKKLLKIKKM